MARVRTLVLGWGLVAAAIAGAADDKKAAKLDPEKLVGAWKVTGGTKDGAKVEKIGADLAVTKDKMTLKDRDGNVFEFAYKIDPKTDPAAVDMEILAPDSFKGAKAKGIVAVDGATAKLAYHPMGGERPKDFAAKKGSGEFSFEWKKAEKK